MHFSETGSLCFRERRKLEVFEMVGLRNKCDIRRNRMKKSLNKEGCVCELSVVKTVCVKIIWA